MKSLLITSVTAFMVTSFNGLPPAPKSRSHILIPPSVADADHTVLNACTSIICTFIDITLALALPDRTCPYSVTVPVITASTFIIPANFPISYIEGMAGLSIPALAIPRETSPDGIT